MNTKVFIYDMALLFNQYTRDRHPLFLVHDNIFDVDQDTLVQCLNYIYKQEEQYQDFQYILTLNRDKIENEEQRKLIQMDIDEHPGGGRGGHWYMPSTIPLSPDARSLWKSGASPVRWLPLPSRCHWQHGQAGWHCCKVPQSFEEVLHDAHRALSEAVRLRSGNVKIPPCLVHSLRPARPDAEVLSHSNGQELHGFVFSFDHLPFLLLCCL